MAWLDSEYLIAIAIGFLWSIQTCGIGYILIFYLLHECYIASRIKVFGIATTGVIIGTSHQRQPNLNESENEQSDDEYFVHYEFQLNPPYREPTWKDKIKISETYYQECKKGQIVRIIFDPITRNSDFYYEGYRKTLCSCDAICFCFIIPFPIASIVTAIYYSFSYHLISGLSCIAFGLVISVPICIYLCKRRNTFCYRFKWKDDIGISRHKSIQDIKDTFNRNQSIHSSPDALYKHSMHHIYENEPCFHVG